MMPTGNLISEQLNGKQRSYQYDSINQLISIQDDDTEKAHYQYDPFGRRISKTVNGETNYYLYSDEGLIAELDQNDTMQVAYDWMPDTVWGTSPLWQVSLNNNQTLKNRRLSLPDNRLSGYPAVGSKFKRTTNVERHCRCFW